MGGLKKWGINNNRKLFFFCYLSAYLNVLRVCSHEPELGDMHDIITVRESPTNESLKTSVNLLPLNGMCPWSLSRALMHSFRASKLLLISAPSILHHIIWNSQSENKVVKRVKGSKSEKLLQIKYMSFTISPFKLSFEHTLFVCHYLWYLLHVHFQQDQ